MSKRWACFIFCLLVTGCAREGIKEERTNNRNFRVDLLFEHDGINVYRFHDNGRYHYFTSRGETIVSQSKHSGKIMYYEDENIE